MKMQKARAHPPFEWVNNQQLLSEFQHLASAALPSSWECPTLPVVKYLSGMADHTVAVEFSVTDDGIVFCNGDSIRVECNSYDRELRQVSIVVLGEHAFSLIRDTDPRLLTQKVAGFRYRFSHIDGKKCLLSKQPILP